MLEIEVDGRALFLEGAGDLQLAGSNIGLNGCFRAALQRPFVARHEETAACLLPHVGERHACRRADVRHVPGVARRSVVGLTAERQPVTAAHHPVAAETGASGAPVVVPRLSLRRHRLVAREPLAPHPQVPVARRHAMAKRGKGAFLAAGTGDQQAALSVARPPRDDVDHPVDRVRTPHRRARPANHFDALDVFEQRVLDLPQHAREEVRVHAAAIHQHQQLVGKAAVEAAHADRPAVVRQACDVDPRRQTQGFRNVGRSRTFDVLATDDVDRCRDVVEPLRLARRAGDLDVEQVLEAHVDRNGCIRRRRFLRQQRRAQARGGQQQAETNRPRICPLQHPSSSK